MTLKQKIFEETLKTPYNLKSFVNFSRELLIGLKISSTRPQKPTQNFSEHIKEFYSLGKQNNIAVLAVNLQKNKSVERARSVQRNFVKTLLVNEISVDGAIVAFYSDFAPEKWRLSFVRLDYNFVAGGAKIKITPAKRYSYLVGENEPCETARQQLFPIFENDSVTVTLDDLENAFSVERVTKEFFDKYAEKFYQVRDFLEDNSDFKIESQAHGFSAEQFTKKLLGQIVFLYFLQKKGWLGVEKNSDWGTGSPNFMRKIFEENESTGKNFFDEVLEPLFYTALNVDRSRQNDLYPKLNLRIPFLNGGLFEELDNYDWQKNNFQIPNEIFSNAKEKGRDADGILDIFDRYNFTINEDEPTEREVAIDPEMLGKVFENLLDASDRKSKGAFYTPREIVHYMCRETLISYLVEKSEISEDAIRNFILYGDYFKDADISNFAENNSLQISEEIFSPAKKINHLAELDKFLQDVKVADLAVGSGAFPLGMLNEITKAREVLFSYLNLGKTEKFSRSLYDLKIETIKNSIFACDIEPSAVDIAKLRLWLSIVIEDSPDASQTLSFAPRPLPNLDCNIICGNSLIDEFEGVQLIKHSKFLNNFDESDFQTSLLQNEVDIRIADLIRVQKNLFHETNHARKEEFRKYIRDIYDDIITEQLGKKSALAKKYKSAASQKSLPFILWQLYFPTVFKNNGGFDIIIGNPPYGAKIPPADKKIYKKNFLCTKTVTGKQKGSTDTFALFIEKSFNLCNKGGIVNLIVPMSVTSSDSMTALHNLLEKNCRVIKISSYSNRPKQIFDAACIRTSIFSFIKTFSPIKNLFTSKMNRRDENHTVKNIIEDLKFVDSLKIKMPGRYPKIGTEIQLEILKKMFSFNKKISDFADENGKPFYYRAAGGRYFNVITDYPTNSSAEKSYFVKKIFTKIIAATLSTNLFWFYQQTFTDGVNIKLFDLEPFPLFDLKKLSKAEISAIENLYSEYLADIEKNVSVRTSSANSSYNVATFKNYKLRNSKNLIDKLDDLIDKFYGLTDEEINYIKNFELEFRISEEG